MGKRVVPIEDMNMILVAEETFLEADARNGELSFTIESFGKHGQDTHQDAMTRLLWTKLYRQVMS